MPTGKDTAQSRYEQSAGDWDGTFAADALNAYHVQACWRAFNRVAGPDLGGTTAVELGVGTGLFTDRLAPLFQRLIAVDFSAQMLEELRAKMARMNVGNVEYLCARAEALEPVAPGSVDAVLCFGLIENIAALDPLFREVRRILKPGGRFAGVASNAACPWYPLRARLAGDKWYWRDVHLRTSQQLRDAALAADLRPGALRGWGLIPSQLPNSALLAPLAGLERILEVTPLRSWMGGLAFRFEAP